MSMKENARACHQLGINQAPKSPQGDFKHLNYLCLAPFRGLGAQFQI